MCADLTSGRSEEQNALTLCYGCSAAGTCRLGLHSGELAETGIAHFNLICPATHEGGPGVAHGAWAAGALDEVLGQVVKMNGQTAVVGTLTVIFRHPIPLERPLIARSWIDKRDLRKWHVAGEIALATSGAVVANATAIFVLRNEANHYLGFQRWLEQQ